MNKITLTILISLSVLAIVAITLFGLNTKQMPQTYKVSIVNSTFIPIELEVNKGDTIIWTNEDEKVHTITPIANNNLEGNILAEGKSFQHTFNTPGIYRYTCDNNQTMQGTITVK